ncbi:MAG: NnrS family protein [Alphaproteobacteria bacterium]|nr:NnrS family protein [Alphaproteobacteria bacterium]
MPGRFSDFFEIPFLGRGFRPFFLLGAIYAVLMVAAWVFFATGAAEAPVSWNSPALWHAHEMIYGFTLASLAGFLLTAVATWTGGAPVRQIHLALLCLVWAAGRVSFWYPYAPPVILSIIDLSFIPLLAASLAVPLIRAWNKRNFVFLSMLALLFLGNLHMHLAAGGYGGDPRLTAYAAVLVVMMVISLVGGRIIPSFTVASLRMQGKVRYQTDQGKTDVAALLLLLALSISLMTSGLESGITAAFAMAAALVHLWRMRFWHSPETGSDPMVWILHVGYLWLVAGLLTLGLHGLKLVEQASLALHMLTVGCIGSMTLGMMARVALGHTGRPIAASSPVVLAFWLMQGAALARCFAILIGAADYRLWIGASGLLWVAAFIIYLAVYAPMLLGPRPDGLEA